MTEWCIQGLVSSSNNNIVCSTVRILIVKWLCPGTNASSAMVQTTTDINTQYNLDATYPYVILYDKQFIMRSPSGGNQTEVLPFEFTYRPSDHHITWADTDTTGLFANTLKGACTIHAFTDVFTASYAPSVSFTARTKFVDN